MQDKYLWLVYVGLAGLAWGTYVPIIFFGGNELGAKPNARLMAILCVGGAYFVIGVLFPLAMFLSNQYEWPEMKPTGLVFSSLAGVAGAVGAICVIFATQAAMGAARDEGATGPALAKYRVFIAPMIFGLAPVINTLVSSIWHPHKGVFHFDLELPGWKLWVGILLVGAGAALVLYSKEEAETQKAPAAKTAAVPVAPRVDGQA
jgi:drug/metabolite transporter (DMT)-like permease